MPEEGRATRKLIPLPAELLEGIDAYRGRLRPIPSESQAIRQLLAHALAVSGGAKIVLRHGEFVVNTIEEPDFHGIGIYADDADSVRVHEIIADRAAAERLVDTVGQALTELSEAPGPAKKPAPRRTRRRAS
jgi:hypothetical protein